MAKAIKGGNKGTKKLAKRCRNQIRKMGFTGPIKTIVCDADQEEVVLFEAAFEVFFGGPILEALKHDDAETLKGLLTMAKALDCDPYELEFCMGHKDGSTIDCDMLVAAIQGHKHQCIETVFTDLADESVEAQRVHPILEDFFATIMDSFYLGELPAEKLESLEQSIRKYFCIRKNAGCLGVDFISTLLPSLKEIAEEVAAAAEPEDIDDEEGVDVQPHSHAPIAPAHSQTSAYSN